MEAQTAAEGGGNCGNTYARGFQVLEILFVHACGNPRHQTRLKIAAERIT